MNHLTTRVLQSLTGVAAIGAILGSTSPAGAETAKSIEEVVVTAQRREESLQAVPLSITALDTETLIKNDATSLNDIMYLVPSMSFGETGFGQNAIIVNIRGQGAFGGRNPSVGMNLNEVPMLQVGPEAPGAFAGGKGLFFDLENVQVVKGPQGTLFGRNTTGGVVLLQTKRPGNEFGGNLSAAYGNYDNQEISGAVDVPIVSDTLLMRLAYSQQERDGYVDVAASPQIPGFDSHDVDYRNIRATLSWMPTDTIRNDLILSDYKSRTNGQQLLIDKLLPGSFVPLLFPNAQDIIDEQNRLGKNDAVGQTLKERFDTDILSVTNLTSIELTDTLTLRNIFGYMEQEIVTARSYDGSGLTLFHRFNVGPQPKRQQTTEEIQLLGTSFNDRLDWTIGFFYLDLPTNGFGRRDTVAFGGLFGPPTQVLPDYSERSYAVYGQGTYSLTEQLKLTVGLRRTVDEAKGITRNLVNNQCVNPVPPFDANCQLTLDDEWKVNTWNVALDYQITPDTLLYGAVRRGFRSGGFNQITSTDPNILSYGEETITDYELGMKSDFQLGGVPVRVNLAVFYDEYEDAQITTNLGTQGLLLGIINGPEAELKGGELEVTLAPSDNLQLSFNASALNMKFKNFPANATPAYITDVAGTEKYGRPDFTYGFSANYRYPMGDAGDLNFYTNYSWKDEEFTNKFRPDTRFDPHGILNVNVGWENAFSHPVDIAFYMTNALDEVYRSYVIAESSLGYASYAYGPPRMYGLRATYRFGAQ